MKYLEIHAEAIEYYREHAITNLGEWIKTHPMSAYKSAKLRLTLAAHFTALFYICPIHVAFYCFAKELDVAQFSILSELESIDLGYITLGYDNLNKDWTKKEEKFLLENFVLNKSFMQHKRLFEALAEI